jgi:hypothetical protein
MNKLRIKSSCGSPADLACPHELDFLERRGKECQMPTFGVCPPQKTNARGSTLNLTNNLITLSKLWRNRKIILALKTIRQLERRAILRIVKVVVFRHSQIF